MEDNKDAKPENDVDISQIESLVVSDNPALEEAIRGYMADRSILTRRIVNLNSQYDGHASILRETREDIATIDQKIFNLIGLQPVITTDNHEK